MASTPDRSHPRPARGYQRLVRLLVSAVVLAASGLAAVASPAAAGSVLVPAAGTSDYRTWDECDRPDWDDVIDWVKDLFERDDRTWDKDTCEEEEPPPPPPPPPPPAQEPPAPAAPPPPPPAQERPAPKAVTAVQPASIFTGELTCGDVASQDESAEAAGVEVRRLSNADGSVCEAVPYVLTSDEDSLRFLKNGSPYAQFIATVEWRYDLEPPTKTTTYVDFELIPGGYELTMPSCPAAVKKNGKLVGLASLDSLTPASLLALGITDMDGLPGAVDPSDNELVQYACVGSRSNRFVNTPGDEHYLLTEQIYILGDIFIRR